MTYQLKDKVVVITGASSGIGAEAARAFAEAGSRVALLARRVDRLQALTADLKGKGMTGIAVACDVRSDGEVEAAFRQIEASFGGVDVLVNNAGLGLYGRMLEVTPEQLRENFETNVFGVLRCVRAAVPMMERRGGGQVLNVSSVLGHRALPMMGGYCASKFALNGLTEALRLELEHAGIDVILVAPGITETEFRDAAMSATDWKESRAPGKVMSAREVALEMVDASRKRKREIILTSAGRFLVRLNRVSPSLCDQIGRQMLKE